GKKGGTWIVEGESYPSTPFKMIEFSWAGGRKFFPAVGEYRHIHHAYDVPTVFGVQNQAVIVVKAEGFEPAQVFRPTHDGLHIERYGLATFRIGEGGLRTQRKHAHFVEEPDVLLRLDVHPLEVVQV